MFEGLRKKIGNYLLIRNINHHFRERKMVNLRNARKVGILYLLDDVPDYNTVSEFVTQLQQDHKEVKALGFVKNKSLVERFLPKLSYDFFSGKDINWFFKPIHIKVTDFISQDFDFLIDLSLADSLPFKYISAHSMAFCRVGRFSEKNAVCYDLMIDVGAGITVGEFIRQITHYLTVINDHEKTY